MGDSEDWLEPDGLGVSLGFAIRQLSDFKQTSYIVFASMSPTIIDNKKQYLFLGYYEDPRIMLDSYFLIK